MTDKEQIIIDGVDVSGCDFLIINRDKLLCRCIKFNSFGDIVNPKNAENSNCQHNCNCYFKQHSRKTQECEQKEKEINELHLIIDRLLEASGYDKNISTAEDFEDVYADINYKLGLLDELKQECEQIKEKYEALKLENEEGYEIVAELKHECEELEKQLETSEKWRIKAESLNENFELKNTCYRKALEEIEKYLQTQLDGFGNDVYEMQKSAINNIRNIISRAKEG